jgi:hypothetical protein
VHSTRFPVNGSNIMLQAGDSLSSKGSGGSIRLSGGAGKSDDLIGRILS